MNTASSIPKEIHAMSLYNESSSTERQPTVLIVDRESHIVDFFELGFSYDGFHVLVAASGPEPLEIARHPPLDVIILLLILPAADGVEVTRGLRKVNDVAIIMLTAKGG